jgi:hypothetical protein
MTENLGLFIMPDEPEPTPAPSVSQPVSTMGQADAPLRPEKTEDDQITPAILKQVIDVAYRFEEVQEWEEALADADFLQIWASRAIVKLNQIASAYRDREAEAVAAERARLLKRGTPEGAILKGRHGRTSLWFDQFGTVMYDEWIVEDADGCILCRTPDFDKAFRRWEQEENEDAP